MRLRINAEIIRFKLICSPLNMDKVNRINSLGCIFNTYNSNNQKEGKIRICATASIPLGSNLASCSARL